MKKILLIGDSIRFGVSEEQDDHGYGYHIKEKLQGVAEVYYPNENCRFLAYTLRYLQEWIKYLNIVGEEIDIIHWNNGLWDVGHLYGDDEIFTSIEQYKKLLVRVHKRIRFLFPNAKIYFALTTPTVEELAPGDSSVRNEDIVQYNKEAISVLSELGVEIVDLHSVAKSIQPQCSLDCVHYTSEGAAILADYIIDKLDL